MSNNLLDLTICLQISKRFPCERAIDFQAIDECGNGNEAVGLDILLELVVGLLVEDNGVVGLVLNYINLSVANSHLGVFGVSGEDMPPAQGVIA